MAKVRIRKVDGQWTSTTPGLGFTGQPRVTRHPSFADALATYDRRGATTGGSTFVPELAYQPVDQAHHAHQRPVCW